MVKIMKKGEKFYVHPSDLQTSTIDETFIQVGNLVDLEITRQFEKWGEQNHSPEMWMVIIQEEFGEVAQEILRTVFDKDLDKRREARYNAQTEIVQTIACLVQLYHRIGANVE